MKKFLASALISSFMAVATVAPAFAATDLSSAKAAPTPVVAEKTAKTAPAKKMAKKMMKKAPKAAAKTAKKK